MVKDLVFAAGKLQASLGTPIAVDPATDYIQFSELEIEENLLMEDVKILSGKFTTEPKIPGNMNVNIKGKMPFCSKSLIAAPECSLILQCGAFALSEIAATVPNKKYQYTRGIAIKDMSICLYECDSSTTSAEITSVNSVMFTSLKLSIESGKVPMLEFTGVGRVGGITAGDVAVAFKTVGVVTKPTQTKIAYSIVNDVTATFMATGYEFFKGDFEFSNKINQKPTWTGYGFGKGEQGGQESKFSASLLKDVALSAQPINVILAKTTGAYTVEFGATDDKHVYISAATAQPTAVKNSTTNDLLSSDISGELIDNACVITFNYDVA